MRPGSLHRACAWRIACSLMNTVNHLSITEQQERSYFSRILVRFMEQYGDVLSSKPIQDQLYSCMIAGLRSRRNPPIYLTTMLVLCPKVTVDQIALIEDRSGVPPPVAGTGLDITSEECFSILEVLAHLPKLPTTSLVLEGVYFHNSDFLPSLFKAMPNLRQIELQYNATPAVLKALSMYCKDLESLCFLEPCMEVSVLEKDILAILFGLPVMEIRSQEGLVARFIQDKKFREKFVLQFPNLRKLDLDELYFEEDVLHDVYILALVLQPKLACFGKHTGLTKRILTKYKEVWNIQNNTSFSDVDIFLTKAKFVDTIAEIPVAADTELKYIEELAPSFRLLKSIEAQKSSWNEEHIARFCRIFAESVDALSLNYLPLSDMSCLSQIAHLRLTFMRQYTFEHVHLILDNCPSLQTLSTHPVFQEYARNNFDRGQHMQHFGRLMDEDRQVLENLLLNELANEMNDVHMFLEDIQLDPFGQEVQNVGAVGNNAAPERPTPRRDTPSKKHRIHSKLLTLRIASLLEAPRRPSETFLSSLLERLPNLRNLCLGTWMGALSQRREHLTCTGNALVTVVTNSVGTQPILTQLEQLCCLPFGTEQEMCRSLASIAECLPCLRTLVVPAIDNFLLHPTLRFFEHTSVEIQHKCATDHVFSHWEPEH